MAKTKQRRRKKHKGTQAGALDTTKRRPRTRSEAKSQVSKSKSGGPAKKRGPRKPSIKGAALRAGLAAGFFLVLVTVILRQPVLPSFLLALVAFVIYVPIGYWVDKWAYGRALKRQGQAAAPAKAEKPDTESSED